MKKLRAALVCAALACVCGGAVAQTAAASPGHLSWSRCFQRLGPFQCTTVRVVGSTFAPPSITVVRAESESSLMTLGSPA